MSWWWRFSTFVVVSLVACGGTEELGSPDGETFDASIDGDSSDASSCCPMSASPRCTYKPGGSRDEAGICSAIVVTDPPLDGWERRIDARGCPYWVVPTTGTMKCGGDAAADGDADGDGGCRDVVVGGASAYQKGKRLDYGDYSSILISALDLGAEIRQGLYFIWAPTNEPDPPYIHTVELRDEAGTVLATDDYHWGEIITYDTPYTFHFGSYLSIAFMCPGGCSESLWGIPSIFDGKRALVVDCGGDCTPASCELLSANCGVVEDGCGGFLRCGTCVGCNTCGGAGTPNRCAPPVCTPRSCLAAKKDCGIIGDDCGAPLDCGACPAGRVCVDNVCVADADAGGADVGCVPRSCDEARAECGLTGDGCGGTLSCGACAGTGMTCGGCSGPPNHCVSG